MPTKKTTTEEEKATKTTKSGKYYYANGKRKTAIARVRLYKGSGEITINDKPIKEYMTVKAMAGLINSPLVLTGNNKKFDVVAKITGGGLNAQAEALRHGIARALVEIDPLNKTTLRKAGMLTRDSRVKERKKYGLKKARKSPQFSKR